MKANSGSLHNLSKVFYYLGISLLITGMMLTFIKQPVAAVPNNDLQLNLSHIMCVDGQVEIHFVLLNVPDGITPGNLTYDYGTVAPTKDSGNVWHFTDYQPSGYYNITFATVVVNGTTVRLHNPGAYSGEYDCSSTATPTVTIGPTLTPTLTATPTETPTPTSTATAIPFEDISFAYVCSLNGTTWYVSNPNLFDVTFSFSVNGGASQDFTVPASTNGQAFASVGSEAGSLVASVNIAGALHEYSVAKETACEVPTQPQDLLLTYVCNVTSMSWSITNPNVFDVPFTYVIDPIQGVTTSSSSNGSAVAPAGGVPYTFYVSTPATHIVQISYDLGDGQTRNLSITNGNDFCRVTVTDTPVPTLQAPPVNSASTVLIPVTGADLTTSLVSEMFVKMQRYFVTFGLGFFGLGMVLSGISKKMR